VRDWEGSQMIPEPAHLLLARGRVKKEHLLTSGKLTVFVEPFSSRSSRSGEFYAL
jgi:hypothetical protein